MANKFWVGGGSTTNWSATVPTNWSDTDGGAGNAAVPSAGDSVFFNGNSGTGASVWQTIISLVMLDCTGSKNVITHSAGITISSGNLVLPTGVGGTYTASNVAGAFTFTGTAGTQQITTNTFKPGGLTLNGAGGTFQLQDNLALLVTTNATITLTNGTFDGQSFTVNTPIFAASGAGTRVLTGSGTWTIGTGTSVGAIWTIAGTTSFSSFTSNITVTGTTASSRTFAGGGLTYSGGLTLGANTSGGSFNITSANIFGTFSVSAPNFITVVASATQTLSNAPTITGSSGNEIGFASATVNTSATISCASGTASFTWSSFRDLTFAGGATFTAANSFDLGRNSGITISAPAAAGSGTSRARIASGF